MFPKSCAGIFPQVEWGFGICSRKFPPQWGIFCRSTVAGKFNHLLPAGGGGKSPHSFSGLILPQELISWGKILGGCSPSFPYSRPPPRQKTRDTAIVDFRRLAVDIFPATAVSGGGGGLFCYTLDENFFYDFWFAMGVPDFSLERGFFPSEFLK